MKFTFIIPMRLNDGREVPQEQMNRIIDELAAQFRGCSDEGVTKGQWLDPKDPQLYRGEGRRISVVCGGNRLVEAQQAVVKIGIELGQRAIPFEVVPHEQPAESEVTRVALAFAQALARGDWSAAHAMLAPSLRDDWQPSELKREYCQMTSYWDKPATSVELAEADYDRAYVAIYSLSESGGTDQEAVDVRVIQKDGQWLIDNIVWGRP